jgi:hypothetical protein
MINMMSQTDGVAGAGNDAAASPASPVLGGATEALIDPPNLGGGSATFADLILSSFTRRGLRTGIVRRNDTPPVQEHSEVSGEQTPGTSVPEAEFVEPAEPNERRLDAGAFTMEEALWMEEFKKLLQSTVDEAVARATGAGSSKVAGTAGARFGTDPEHEHRQRQYQQDMHRYDAAGYINDNDEMYGSRGVERCVPCIS